MHSTRTTELDGIKGIMIVLMVFGHVTFVGSLAQLLQSTSNVMHTFRMPFFLILCGYFFSLKRPTGAWLKYTFRRVLVPYFVFEALYIMLLSVVQLKGLETHSHIQLSISNILTALFLHPIGAYWFLYTLALFQLTTAGAIYLAAKLKTIPWFVILLLLLLLENSLGLVQLGPIQFFLLGLCLKCLKMQLPDSLVIGCVVIGFICWTTGLPFDSTNDQPNYISIKRVLWVIAILSLINGFFRRFPKLPTLRFWQFLGQNTLIIFLAHPYFINITKPLSKIIITFFPYGLLYTLIITIIGVAGPLLVAWLTDWLTLSPLLFGKDQIFIGWRAAHEAIALRNSAAKNPVISPAPEAVL